MVVLIYMAPQSAECMMYKKARLKMKIPSLCKKFGILNKLDFKEIAAGIAAIEVDTALATASISLMGGGRC